LTHPTTTKERPVRKHTALLAGGIAIALASTGCKTQPSASSSVHQRVLRTSPGQSQTSQQTTQDSRQPGTKRTTVQKVKAAPTPKVCTITPTKFGWYDKAYLTTDRRSLRLRYKRQRYRLPHKTRSMMMATRIVKGVGQPAFQYYSLANTGFRYSHGPIRWWPASCVKPWAVAGALMTLSKYGLNGRTKLRFRDRYGTFKGTVWHLYRNITNKSYDRMAMIAGIDNLNTGAWKTKYSQPNLIIQRAYGGIRTLRRSPTIYSNHNGKRGVIKARYSRFKTRRCRSNCTTLFELQDVLRRIVLHNELPKKARFTITPDDVKRIRKAFLKIPNKMGRAFRKVWGRRSKGYNKSGSARGWDQIENVYIEPQRSKYRFMFAGSVPWWRKDYMADPSLLILNEFGLQTMVALKRLGTRRVSLQLDAGPAIRTQLHVSTDNPKQLTLSIKSPESDKLLVWLNTRQLSVKTKPKGLFRVDFRIPRKGKQLLVIQGFKGKQAIAYKSLGFAIQTSRQAPSCQPKPLQQ
jgi:hypothetical protein